MGAAATWVIDNAMAPEGWKNTVAGAVGVDRKKGKDDLSPSAPPSQNTNENEARKAAERRRRMYAGVGRSSTILTQGLGSSAMPDDSAPKQLLGL